MTSEILSCGGCGRRTTRGLANEHHVKPRAAGGASGAVIDLCVECHALIHRVAEGIRHNRAQSLIDQLRILYPSEKVQARLLELATTVAHEMLAAHRGERALDPDEPVAVSFKLPRAVHRAAAEAASMLRSPGSGRRIGVPGLAQELLLDYLKTRGLIR